MNFNLIEKYKRWQEHRRNYCKDCFTDKRKKSHMVDNNNLIYVSAFKLFSEYKCEKCNSVWCAPKDSEYLWQVYSKEVYEEWKHKDCIPTDSQSYILAQIVGVRDDYFSGVYYPCSVQLSDESILYKTLLIITTGAFFGYKGDVKIELLNNTHLIMPSKFALPASVRSTTMNAEEVSMCYSPVSVKDKHGKNYTLSNKYEFFDYDDTFGSEITLDKSTIHGENKMGGGKIDLYLICDPLEIKKV